MRVFYVIRVNAAIARLGINPQHVPADLRQRAQEMGKSMGATPQEAALMLVSQLPIAIRAPADYRVVKLWVRERRIRVENPAMQQAAANLGWQHWP
jgi:hypothetical protein